LNFPADTTLDCEIRPAANFGERRGRAPVDMLVLHYTGMKDENEALDWLLSADSSVSCHYFIFEDGRIVQTVPEALRAWHAGAAGWRGHSDINSRSVGIEIANPGHEHGYRPFPDIQMEAVIRLCRDIVTRRDIEPRNLVAHSDIAPMRKQDPGELFPWKRLSEAGLGHFVEAEPVSGGRFFQLGDSGDPVAALQEMLALHGYEIGITGVFDEITRACISAFQRHFRQERVDGVADVSTIATLHKSLQALMVS
jgi:N-acetylmuramoyl-L-alanine amidase